MKSYKQYTRAHRIFCNAQIDNKENEPVKGQKVSRRLFASVIVFWFIVQLCFDTVG